MNKKFENRDQAVREVFAAVCPKNICDIRLSYTEYLFVCWWIRHSLALQLTNKLESIESEQHNIFDCDCESCVR